MSGSEFVVDHQICSVGLVAFYRGQPQRHPSGLTTISKCEQIPASNVMRTLKAIYLALVCALFAIVSNAQAASYNIVNLGMLPGTSTSSPCGINDSGQVVGMCGSFATLWAPGSSGYNCTNLGTGRAYAINNSGMIVGESNANAILWRITGSTITYKNIGIPSTISGAAYDINDRGAAVGMMGGRAVLWDLSTDIITAISLLPLDNGTGSTSARGINASGQIAGTSSLSGSVHPTLWTGADGQYHLDLGLVGSTCFISALNDRQQVIGVSFTSSPDFQLHNILWNVGGATVEIGKLDSLSGTDDGPVGINNAGQVVGNSRIQNNFVHGFVWTATDGIKDINTLVGNSPIATEIAFSGQSYPGNRLNNFGQIVGTGKINGQYMPILLTPAAPLSSVAGGTQETKAISQTAYTSVPAFTNPMTGSNGTQASLIGGSVGSGGGTTTYGLNRVIVQSFVANPSSVPLASDALDLEGTVNDMVVVQFTYNKTSAQTLFASGSNSRLAWYNGACWVDASDGNTGGTKTFAGDRAYNAATDFHLGTYGVDTKNNVVWAVVNHGGIFGVALAPELLTKTKSVVHSGRRTTVAVDSFTGHTYQLQYAASLAGVFSDVGAPQTGSTGNVLTFTNDDGGALTAFYRVRSNL